MQVLLKFSKEALFACAIVGVLAGSVWASEPVLKTLSAHTVAVETDGSAIEVDFRHPATRKVQRMKFFVDNQTGLSGIAKLQDLRAGQVVNIDYVEETRGRLCIRRIARVKLSGPPPGLENFRGL